MIILLFPLHAGLFPLYAVLQIKNKICYINHKVL